MTEPVKHTKLPWRVGTGCSDQVISGNKRLLRINDEVQEWSENGNFIVLACNHFEELREAARKARTIIPMGSELEALEAILSKIEEAEKK